MANVVVEDNMECEYEFDIGADYHNPEGDTQTVYEAVHDVEVAHNVDPLGSGEGIHADREGDDGIVESDYDQEDEDIAMDTCVDTTSNWENFQPPEIPRNEDEDE